MQQVSPQLPSVSTQALRNDLLGILLSAEGQAVSGERLSEQFGMSRTAIWKYIQSLIELGFGIISVPRSGYLLQSVPNILYQPLLAPHLKPGIRLGHHVLFIESTDSTNRLTHDHVADLSHGSILCARTQRGGKGRHGREWFSPDSGLWFSMLIKQPIPLRHAAELTLLTSLAVCRSIRSVLGLPADIKWPNDILIHGRKACGILAEIRADGEVVNYAVIGIGLNTNMAEGDFPTDIRNRATSLCLEGGQRVDHNQLVGQILNELDELLPLVTEGGLGFAAVHDEWCRRCVTIGQSITVQAPQGLLHGVATEVNEFGVLTLLQDDGSVARLHSGEILFGTNEVRSSPE